MPDLEPITRDEKLWSGEDLEPITRREMYIKHLYDETQVIPDKPITREEMFILKAGEELHDVTIEQLTATENRTYSEEGVAYSPVIVNVPQTTLTTLDVTENGTYTAPSGTAYDEVEVDVPLPDNAYLLKEIEDVEIATFTDGSALPMPKLEVEIEPIQEGSGDPSPTNIRPISGWSAVDVNKSGANQWDEEWEVGGLVRGTLNSKNFIPVIPNTTYFFTVLSEKYPDIYWYDENKNLISYTSIQYNSTFTTPNNCHFIKFRMAVAYGTTYNNDISINYPSTDTEYHAYNGHTYTIQLGDTYYGGKLDVVSGVLTVDRVYKDLGDYTWTADTGVTGLVRTQDNTIKYMGNIISSQYKGVKNLPPANMPDGSIQATNVQEYLLLRVRDERLDGKTVTEIKTMLTGVQMVAELATPTTIQLTPTVVSSLLGVNNIWADCGKIIDGKYFSKGE